MFEMAKSFGSKVTHSSIHSGLGIGLSMVNAENITFSDSSIVSHVEHGVWLRSGNNKITLDNNWVHYIIPHRYYFEELGGPKMFEYTGWTGCMTLSDPSNNRLIVTNNVVSGCWQYGFHYVPLQCNEVVDADTVIYFFGNVAHSISGYGAIAANVVNSCTEVKDFAAYKVTESSIMLGGGSGTNRGRDLVSIDVRYGIGIHGGECGNVELLNSDIYGELRANEDCYETDISDCDHCIDRTGLIFASIYTDVHRDSETIDWGFMPLFNYSDCFEGSVTYTNLKFHNFNTDAGVDSFMTKCESYQSAMGPYKKEANYVPFIQMINPQMDNVE